LAEVDEVARKTGAAGDSSHCDFSVMVFILYSLR
jgi:hypothetical protein